jgi:two-component system phosphate regulon response regulator OmpR
VRFGPLVFDVGRRSLRRGEDEVRLTTAEAELLTALARNPGVPMSREELSQQGEGDGSSRTVDVQMTRLRRKIEPDPRFPRYLQTVRGRGYVLRPD